MEFLKPKLFLYTPHRLMLKLKRIMRAISPPPLSFQPLFCSDVLAYMQVEEHWLSVKRKFCLFIPYVELLSHVTRTVSCATGLRLNNVTCQLEGRGRVCVGGCVCGGGGLHTQLLLCCNPVKYVMIHFSLFADNTQGFNT